MTTPDSLVSFHRTIDIDIPAKTRQNGTLYLHVVLANDNGPFQWQHLHRDGVTVMQRVSLTQYMVPRAEMFNLLGNNKVLKHGLNSLRMRLTRLNILILL